MLQQREMEMQRRMMPQHPPQMFHTVQQFQQLPPAQNQNHQQKPQVKQQKPQVIEVIQGKKGVKVYHTGGGSPKSSHSSFFSDDSYSADESNFTPNSSIESSASHSSLHRRRRSHSRRRHHHQHHDRPEQYGIHPQHRHPRQDQQHYILDSLPIRIPAVPVAPTPPLLMPSPIDIEQIQDEAYHMGRADERAVVRATEEVAYRPRIAPLPRVIQRRPSVRFVDPREALDQMRFDDELYEERLYHDDRFHIEDDYRRREPLGRLRPQRYDDISYEEEEEEEMMFEERARDARDYVRHREPPFVEYVNPNPFAPTRGRRQSYAEYHI